MEKKHIVYILGAGSSKDFGLPLGNEIFYKAKEILEAVNKQEAGFKTVYEKVFYKAEADLKQIYLNLPDDRFKYPLFEEVLSFIYYQIPDQEKLEYDSFDKKGTAELPKKKLLFDGGIRKVFETFVNLMGLTILGSMYHNDSIEKIEVYERFIKSLIHNREDISFISLNYDTIFDNILLKCQKENVIDGFNYGISRRNISCRDIEIYKDGSISLLKPHGSLNLFFCSHKYHHSVEPGFYYFENHKAFIDMVDQNQDFRCPHCSRMPLPLIIPPLYNKAIFLKDSVDQNQPSGGLWTRDHLGSYRFRIDRQISQALTSADEIMIIGYSMPAYDVDFKSLLISSLMSNEKRRNVVVRIITKATSGDNLQTAISQYEQLVGKVVVEADEGFYNYLTREQT